MALIDNDIDKLFNDHILFVEISKVLNDDRDVINTLKEVEVGPDVAQPDNLMISNPIIDPVRFASYRLIYVKGYKWLKLDSSTLHEIKFDYNLSANQVFGMLFNLIKFGICNKINLGVDYEESQPKLNYNNIEELLDGI